MARRAHPDQAFVDELCLRLRSLGLVTARAMFGGHGLYLHGAMFVLIADGEAYFKVDAANQADFAAMHARPFVYHGKGKPVQMSYQALPADDFEDDHAVLRAARWPSMPPCARSRQSDADNGQRGIAHLK